MAKLRRSEDGHYFIRPAPNLGTWQVSDRGVAWLKLEKQPLPAMGEGVFIKGHIFEKLKNKGYAYIYGNSYPQQAATTLSEINVEPEATGLPLFLQQSDNLQYSWILKIELSGLSDDEKSLEAIRRLQCSRITMNTASFSISPSQLLNLSCQLEVRPQTQPYLVLWENIYKDRSTLKEAPETPGLSDNYTGNVFAQTPQAGMLWRRYLPGSTFSFSGTILWLAKIGCKHEWPARAQRIGALTGEWLLWQLDIPEDSLVALKEIEQWFSERGINITNQHQQVQLLSPPEYVNDSEHATFKPGTPLLFQCLPPRRLIGGIIQQSYLTATTFQSNEIQLDRASQTQSLPITVDKTNFFSWQPPRPGQYRIRLSGDTLSESLIVRVNAATIPPTQWLKSFSCTISSENLVQTFRAFQDTPVDNETDAGQISDQFTRQQLETLAWVVEPDNLPVRISWKDNLARETRQDNYSHIIRSNAELTMHWREHIWAQLTNSPDNIEVYLTLDAGSFGLIELTIIPMIEQEEDEGWWSDEQLCTQLVWLSRAIFDSNSSPRAIVPASLRQIIRQAGGQTQHLPVVYRALVRLASAEEVPIWIIIRLQTLLKEVVQ